MQIEGKPHSLDVPEEHVDSVRSLLKVLGSRSWVADFITDLLDHYEIFGAGTCTPDWVAERIAGPALFWRGRIEPSEPFRERS